MPIGTNKAPATYAPPREPTYAQWIAEQMLNYADTEDKPVPAVDISGRTRRQKLVNMPPHSCMGYNQRSYRVHFGL